VHKRIRKFIKINREIDFNKYISNKNKIMTNKYIATPDTLKDILYKYGVAILPNILTIEECNYYNQETWKAISHLTFGNFNPNDPNTFHYFYDYLLPKHNMLVQQNVGHLNYVWEVRQHPNIVKVFSKFWNIKPEDLLVSFDGISIHLPPEITNKGWRERAKKWLHCDQNFRNSEFEALQSFISFNDINNGDASLCFLEGSHKFHSSFASDTNNSTKEDWYKLTNEDINYYTNKGCQENIIQCSAGSLVLWDSRTIHCGLEASKLRTEMNVRNIVYLCYTPRIISSEKNLKKKRDAFNELRMTSHWPHRPKLFPVKPYNYGKPIPEINPPEKPVLNDLGLKLAGF
jgi:hypothetical protein